MRRWTVDCFFILVAFISNHGFFDCSNAVHILKWILKQPDLITWAWGLNKILSFQASLSLAKISWMNALSFHSCISFCTRHNLCLPSLLYFVHVSIHKLCHRVKDCSIFALCHLLEVSMTELTWRFGGGAMPVALSAPNPPHVCCSSSASPCGRCSFLHSQWDKMDPINLDSVKIQVKRRSFWTILEFLIGGKY